MTDLESRTMRKVTRRFVPLLIVCFVISFLDRVNVGFAALTMSADLRFTSTVFGLGAGLFFIGYFFFEVPSNLALERVGARRWIARIMFTWGILSGLTAFITGPWSYYAVRILLGAAEAGFFPGVILFLTYWIPERYRGRVVGAFMAAMPFASVFGSPLSGWLLGLNGVLGLKGWQLMFIAEAVPSLVLAVVILMVLRDSPAHAEWLAEDERAWLTATLNEDRQRVVAVNDHGFINIVKRPVILMLAAAYFGIVGINFGLSFFLPQIVREFHLSLMQVGLVAAIPFAVGGLGMLWWGRRSDHHDERRFHVLFPMGLAVAGLAGSTVVTVPALKLALLCLASFGVFSALPIFWALLPGLLGPAVAAVGFAVINSLGNLSGFAAPYVVGVIKDATGSTAGGLQAIAIYGAIAWLILSLVSRRHRRGSELRELSEARS
ncbi:Nitrate/nitrite transporter [Paraburkholderia caribensis MBA4]|uniref:Nitrate/nitrite transporter n=1 Tax=Paraburkholderia caribensis MBA4 TaxID=1323664 RepID=A0A0P0RIF0_9BURK|nr:MFS transporter [Paraburkholderia caribensis]ALL68529.1 Nitrate/nitrite transporter [Paraburkholderia caribensis MBA4]